MQSVNLFGLFFTNFLARSFLLGHFFLAFLYDLFFAFFRASFLVLVLVFFLVCFPFFLS